MLYVLLLINPLLSFIFFVYYLKNRKTYIENYYLYLAFLMGIIGMGMPITENFDLLRHYYHYEHTDLSMPFLEFLSHKKDFFIYTIYYFGKLNNLKKELMTLLVVFLSYYFYLKSYFIINKVGKSKYIGKKLIFFLFFISLPFGGIVYALRMDLALSSFLYGVCLLLGAEKKKGILFILFSIIVHFSVSVCIIILIIFYILRDKNSLIKNLFLLSVLFIFIPSSYIQIALKFLIEILPLETFKSVANVYIDGYWGTEYVADRSIKGRIYMILFLVKYIWIYIYIKYYCLKKRVNTLNKFLVFLGIFVFFIFSMPQLRERYVNLPYILSIILFSIEPRKKKKHIYYLIIIALIAGFIDFYRIRSGFFYGGLTKLLYPTIYTIIYDNIDYFQWLNHIY